MKSWCAQAVTAPGGLCCSSPGDASLWKRDSWLHSWTTLPYNLGCYQHLFMVSKKSGKPGADQQALQLSRRWEGVAADSWGCSPTWSRCWMCADTQSDGGNRKYFYLLTIIIILVWLHHFTLHNYQNRNTQWAVPYYWQNLLFPSNNHLILLLGCHISPLICQGKNASSTECSRFNFNY